MFELLITSFIIVIVLATIVEGVLPAIKEMLERAQTLPQGGLIDPNLRRAQMEDELGREWGPWNPEADADLEFDRPTMRSVYVRRYYGPMDMDIAGDQVLIYDMQLGIRINPQNPEQVFQTVISIKPPELRLPPFILRSKGFLAEQFSTLKSVKTGTALDEMFMLESLTPHRVKALFQSELGTEVLIPFLTDHNWTVEWSGDFLIVYELNRLIEPQQLAEVALEVSELFELLKSGPAVVDRLMKEFIREAAPRV